MSVASMRIVVVLPAPFGPSTPYTPPALTARSTPATAWVLPKLFFNPLVSIASFPMGSIPSLGVANGLVALVKFDYLARLHEEERLVKFD